MSRADFRPEIQGLRAIAVIAVIAFHVWPNVVPGGYVGVDVFFVISGFLITAGLVREVQESGRIALGAFYMRRARRLLPAAMLVLLATAMLTPLLLPSSQWLDTAYEILASTFYVENWRLAEQAVDYLAAENVPSPVQHYWSLSIEEQFYLFWPLLIIAGVAVARRSGARQRTLLCLIFGGVAAVSLAVSVWLTKVEPAAAYFVTHTRIWELAFGGLLAIGAPVLGRPLPRMLSAVGMTGILAASFLFSSQTPFPGIAALLPTLGAAMILASGEAGGRFGACGILRLRPVQFLGDISYSLYLWHWPLVVFARSQDGGTIGSAAGVAILAGSLVLAALTKVHVEDRFRARGGARMRWRMAASFAAALAIVPAAAFGMIELRVADQVEAVRENPGHYPGAMAISDGVPVPPVAFYAPPLTMAKFDVPATEECRLSYEGTDPTACRFGDPAGTHKVFLIGDSHAEQWVPAFADVAARRRWNAASYTKSSCAFTPEKVLRDGRPYEECFAWGRRMRQIIRDEKPDLVIVTHRNEEDRFGSGATVASVAQPLADLWRDIARGGTTVVVIADTPEWGERPDDCLARDVACAVDLRAIARPDPLISAHRLYPRAALVDFTDVLCPGERCPAVIGNVVVWRDRHHLTATFARSMANLFGRRIDAALAQD